MSPQNRRDHGFCLKLFCHAKGVSRKIFREGAQQYYPVEIFRTEFLFLFAKVSSEALAVTFLIRKEGKDLPCLWESSSFENEILLIFRPVFRSKSFLEIEFSR